MPVKPIATLKSFFETGDRPTQEQFWDLIDSFIHKQTGTIITDKSYEEATGLVSFSFSDNTAINFNVKGNESEPISFINGLQAALDNKVDKEVGKGLSQNDFTNADKIKLDGLENYVAPTSYEISFINGLQAVLDEKALDSEVVKSVNGEIPDDSGNVNVNITGGGSYDLSNTVATLNYTYFGKTVYGILLTIPDPQSGSSNYSFPHNLGIGKYLRLEVWEDGLPDNPTEEVARQDLTTLVYNNAGFLSLDENNVDAGGYTFPANKLLYIEYTAEEVILEGISADAIGTAAIGAEITES